MESITLRDDERSNTGGNQEKFWQPSGRYPSICIPALSRGLDLIALQAPSNVIILGFYNSQFCIPAPASKGIRSISRQYSVNAE